MAGYVDNITGLYYIGDDEDDHENYENSSNCLPCIGCDSRSCQSEGLPFADSYNCCNHSIFMMDSPIGDPTILGTTAPIGETQQVPNLAPLDPLLYQNLQNLQQTINTVMGQQGPATFEEYDRIVAHLNAAIRPGQQPAATPNVTAEDITARLNLILNRTPAAQPAVGFAQSGGLPPGELSQPAASSSTSSRTMTRAQIMEQTAAHMAVHAMPQVPPDPTRWRPPYSWDPQQPHGLPSIFTHPRYGTMPIIQQTVADPPIAPEYHAHTQREYHFRNRAVQSMQTCARLLRTCIGTPCTVTTVARMIGDCQPTILCKTLVQ